ncbi:hypothetical protein [uncultured Jannaschia sp.]|uniref:hypothetical protein n=1 Tax=uncultured Jannaschia sp. TaxID=293347 RepID=UPI002627A5DF|nr:hypothetical protein [uncultured Jannaschia sp.]
MSGEGTQTKPGHASGQAPGDGALTHDDVAPNGGRAKLGLLALLALIVVILAVSFLWADDAPVAADGGPEAVIVDDGTLGD